MCIRNNHWVLYCVGKDVDHKFTLCLDSLWHGKEEFVGKKLKKFFQQHVLKNPNEIMNHYNNNAFEEIYQQNNSHDCGIICILWMKLILEFWKDDIDLLDFMKTFSSYQDFTSKEINWVRDFVFNKL
jgi:Ulp1 family protease